MIAPVDVLNDNPAGSAGDTLNESAVQPLLVMVCVEIAVPTVAESGDVAYENGPVAG